MPLLKKVLLAIAFAATIGQSMAHVIPGARALTAVFGIPEHQLTVKDTLQNVLIPWGVKKLSTFGVNKTQGVLFSRISNEKTKNILQNTFESLPSALISGFATPIMREAPKGYQGNWMFWANLLLHFAHVRTTPNSDKSVKITPITTGKALMIFPIARLAVIATQMWQRTNILKKLSSRKDELGKKILVASRCVPKHMAGKKYFVFENAKGYLARNIITACQNTAALAHTVKQTVPSLEQTVDTCTRCLIMALLGPITLFPHSNALLETLNPILEYVIKNNAALKELPWFSHVYILESNFKKLSLEDQCELFKFISTDSFHAMNNIAGLTQYLGSWSNNKWGVTDYMASCAQEIAKTEIDLVA